MFVLQMLVGGVVVCLFVIYFNVLDIDLYLWIVLELFFKCCIVGGFDKVFEFN